MPSGRLTALLLSLVAIVAIPGTDALAAGPRTATRTEQPHAPALTPGPAGTAAPRVASVTAIHRGGQTFIVWPERTQLRDEAYLVYRSTKRITRDTLDDARLLGVVGKHSSRVWSERRWRRTGAWAWRHLSQAVIPVRGRLSTTTGLFVWTPSRAEVDRSSGGAHYAVVVRKGSVRSRPTPSGRVAERAAAPRPVKAQVIPGQAQVLLQYMDLHTWNGTLDAPNPLNDWLGYARDTPGVRRALSVAYTYVVAEPRPRDCPGGVVPRILPLVVQLHGFGGQRNQADVSHARWCSVELRPLDPSVTRWFGFAMDHDYRRGGVVEGDDRIANFTEARVLRAITDLFADGRLGPRIDRDRVYVLGGSMGGTGAVSFALRYPEIFAAAHAWSPIPDYATTGGMRRGQLIPLWGTLKQDLPIRILGPSRFTDDLQPYAGTGAWTWQDHTWSTLALRGRDSVPLGLFAGTLDRIAPIDEVAPFYQAMDRAGRTFTASFRVTGHVHKTLLGLGPNLATRNGVPFRGLTVIQDETVPGLANDSRFPAMPPSEAAEINTAIEWSASWAPWDGTPVDRTDRWRMSFRTRDGQDHEIDVIPRRLERFVVDRTLGYRWTVTDVKTGDMLGEGTARPDKHGLLTVRIPVTPDGTRLLIESTGPAPARDRNRNRNRNRP